MPNYKEATKIKLQFTTTKGNLSVEQLWDLNIRELDTLAVELENEVKQQPKKSFLVEDTNEDKVAKLKFELALDVLQTKLREKREKEEKIMSLSYSTERFRSPSSKFAKDTPFSGERN